MFSVKPLISKPHKTEVLVTSNDVDVNDLSQKGGGFKTSLKVGGIMGGWKSWGRVATVSG